MKKVLLGLLIGLVLGIPATAFATTKEVQLPHANSIYDVAPDDSIHVDVFDDADNKCYVAYRYYNSNKYAEQPSISCLKQ